MKIAGLQKTSLIDYPDKVAALIFTQGCNLNCVYCHNKELISLCSDKLLNNIDIKTFLSKRKNILDAVVITGGEPTVQENLKSFIYEIKKLGYLIKLDTNGLKPKIIQEILNENLIDYIAVDIKAPLEKYNVITQTDLDTNLIKQTIDIVLNSSIDYEFRTTIVKNFLNENDLIEIGLLINGAKKLYLQQYKNTNKIIENNLCYTKNEIKNISLKLTDYIKNVKIRY